MDSLSAFFDQFATVRNQTVKVCAFPPEKADPLADSSLDASTTVATILVKRIGFGAWNDPSNPPKVGDTIQILESEFSIISVDLFDDNYFTIRGKLK